MKKYKVVCVTPAGRRRYMRYLVPLVLASPVVDRYDIWVNTDDVHDITFLEALSQKFPKIRLVKQPDGVIDGFRSIGAFFRHAIDIDTIYIRLDDDILWIEPGFFQKLVEFRIAHPDYFLVSPLVINNAICTHILQTAKKLDYPHYISANCFDKTGWEDERFAEWLHTWFMRKLSYTGHRTPPYADLYCGIKPIALNRFSINSICWFGRTFRQFGGEVMGDEEEYLTVTKPEELGLVNCFHCDVIAAHFAFYTQRDYLDTTDIPKHYALAARKMYKNSNSDFEKIFNQVQLIYSSVGGSGENTQAHEIRRNLPAKLKKIVSTLTFLRK